MKPTKNAISNRSFFEDAKRIAKPYAEASGEDLTEYLLRDFDANPYGWDNGFEYSYDDISAKAKEERREVIGRMIAAL